MKTPNSFFKFVGKDRINILSGGMIRFTPPADFNDPFELTPIITHLTKCEINRRTTNAFSEYQYEEADHEFSLDRSSKIEQYQKIVEQYANKHGVLSLSASYDINPNPAVFMGHDSDPRRNLLMWAHYCDNHTGFVIEFARDFIQGTIEEVIYTSKRPTLTFEEIDAGDRLIYLHKSIEWEYENEWRCIKKLDEADDEPNPGVHLFRFNKEAVRSITFGCRASEETRETVINILNSDIKYKHTKTFFANLDKNSFSLSFHQEIPSNGQCWSNAEEFSGKSIDIQKLPDGF